MIAKHLPHLSPATFHILLALRNGQLHGYEIIKRVEADSESKLILLTGTLYNSLKRLLGDALIIETSPKSGRRRYYQLTKAGESLLAAELERYQMVVSIATSPKEIKLFNV